MFFRLISACVLALTAAPLAAAPVTAIFPFELIDTSQQGEMSGVNSDETRRLQLISDELVKLVKEDGQRYAAADVSDLKAEIEEKSPLHKCNGCETDLAKKVGAEVALVGTVQKVSNLILNLNLYSRDVSTGNITRVMSADIRSNTDDAWLRGIRYLVKNRLLAEESLAQ